MPKSKIQVIQSSTKPTHYSITKTVENKPPVIINLITKNPISTTALITINGVVYSEYNIVKHEAMKDLYKQILGVEARISLNRPEFVVLMSQIGFNIKEGIVIQDKTPDTPLKPQTLTKTHLTMLHRPDLLNHINNILHNTSSKPFIGEDANTLITFLSMLSSKTNYGITLDVIGSSAAGKTYMIMMCANAFHPDTKLIWTSASKQALTYSITREIDEFNKLIDIDHKILIILEKEESEQFIKQTKPLMSHDNDEIIIPKATSTGEGYQTVNYIIRGNASFVLCSTKNIVDEEEITRVFSVSPSESFDKIASVCRTQMKHAGLPTNMITIHPDLKTLQEITKILPPAHIINIFVQHIDGLIPYNTAQRQRDITRIISLINAVTLIHQYQRPYYFVDNVKNVFSSIEDNILGLTLLDQILEPSLTGLSTRTLRIYEHINDLYEKGQVLKFSRIFDYVRANRISLSKHELHDNHIERLIDRGYINLHKRSKHMEDFVYTITPANEILSRIKTLTPIFIDKVKDNLSKTLKAKVGNTTYLKILDNCLLDESVGIISEYIGKKLTTLTKPGPQVKQLLSFNYFTKDSSTIFESFAPSFLFQHKHPLLQIDEKIHQEWEIDQQVRESVRKKIIKGTAAEDIDYDKLFEKATRKHGIL